MHSSPLPVLALLFNALVWGVAWWPFRRMYEAGLHPLWATALMYGTALTLLLYFRPRILRQIRQHPGLLLLALASGITNISFNWAVTIGDVVRVILLFYLMPAWSVLLAWRILGERPTLQAIARLALAFGGVALVIWPAEGGLQRLLAALSLADGLALMGGFTFALASVTLKRMQAAPGLARMSAMFFGCMTMALIAAFAGSRVGLVSAFPAPNFTWVSTAVLLTCLLFVGNWALQYGAARLAASVTAVVMLSEVPFASISSVLLGAAQLDARGICGGMLILMAAAWSAWPRHSTRTPDKAAQSSESPQHCTTP